MTLGQYIVVSSDLSWNMRAQSSIPKFLTDELEHIQRRALKIIVPHLSIVNITRGFGRPANFKGSSALS